VSLIKRLCHDVFNHNLLDHFHQILCKWPLYKLWTPLVGKMSFDENVHSRSCINMHVALKMIIVMHYEKKWCFATRLATQCIITLMNIIKQVAWVARNAIHCLYSHTLMQLISAHLQSIPTTPFQVLCNSFTTTTILSCWHHFLSIHQNTRHYEDFWMIFFEMLMSTIYYDCSF
jgi:hypothetical protein